MSIFSFTLKNKQKDCHINDLCTFWKRTLFLYSIKTRRNSFHSF